jgi:radical SAM superfamily enzyme YgiQ (UPF0313 family)
MRVLVLNSPSSQKQKYIKESRCMQPVSSWSCLWFPLTLANIYTIIRQAGFSCKLLDCQENNMKFSDISIYIDKYPPDVLILNSGFPSIKDDFLTASIVKRTNKSCKIILIGMLPTLLKKEVFELSDCIDYIIVGEPEFIIVNLLKSIKENDFIYDLLGVIYRSGNHLNETPNQIFKNNDLNDLPIPERDFGNLNGYKYPLNKKRFTLISISRGCEHSCIFCAARKYHGAFYRKRNIDFILREIEECITKYKIYNFLFWCESIAYNREYTVHLLKAIIRAKLKINWSARARIDELDSDLIILMKKAGCRSLSLGIESVDVNVQKGINKIIDIERLQFILNLLNNVGILSIGHFVFGFPNDDLNSAFNTIDFASRSKLDFAQFYCALPYPNTPLWQIAQRKKWIEEYDYSLYYLSKVTMHNDTLSCYQIANLRYLAYKKFYYNFDRIRKKINLQNMLLVTNFSGFRKWIYS